jgi:type IV pilus assembly protein PilC
MSSADEQEDMTPSNAKQTIWKQSLLPFTFRSLVPFHRLQRATDIFGELSIALSTGTPLHEAVERLSIRKSTGAWHRRVLGGFVQPLRDGAHLSDLVKRRGYSFPYPSAQIIRQGEVSGNLPQALRRAAEQLNRRFFSRWRFRNRYNQIIGTVAVFLGVAGFLNYMVMPMLFATAEHAGMPAGSWFFRMNDILSLVIGLADRYLLATILALAILLSPRTLIVRMLRLSLFRWLADLRDYLILPGSSGRRMSVAGETLIILGDLLDAGVALPDALNLAGPASGSIWFERVLARMANSVGAGQNAAEVVRSSGIIPPDIGALIAARQFNPEVCRDTGDWLISQGQSKIEVAQQFVRLILLILISFLVFVQAAAIHLFSQSLIPTMI